MKSTVLKVVFAPTDLTELMEFAQDALIRNILILTPIDVCAQLALTKFSENACLPAEEMR